MKRQCIAVVDATRARVFSFAQVETPPGTSGQEMEELLSLENPERHKTAGELFSESRPGSFRTAGGRGYAPTDHRDENIGNMDKLFSRTVVSELRTVLDRLATQDLVLAASPNMLGLLRQELEPLVKNGLAVSELSRDLTQFSPAQLHDYLSQQGILPPRERLTRVR
jgi:protein required for attachment to host cells